MNPKNKMSRRDALIPTKAVEILPDDAEVEPGASGLGLRNRKAGTLFLVERVETDDLAAVHGIGHSILLRRTRGESAIVPAVLRVRNAGAMRRVCQSLRREGYYPVLPPLLARFRGVVVAHVNPSGVFPLRAVPQPTLFVAACLPALLLAGAALVEFLLAGSARSSLGDV